MVNLRTVPDHTAPSVDQVLQNLANDGDASPHDREPLTAEEQELFDANPLN